ncbi:MAG TPA: ABC transporter permease, partial [Blastocatellia bacterium]|nr:ABC transporter permease [Blastocatellia bacterium]
SLGTDLMWITPESKSPDAGQRIEPLQYEDAVALSEVPGIKEVGPRASRPAILSFDQAHVSGQILGVNPGYFTMRNKTVALGRPLLSSDLEVKRRVCVVGPGLVERLLYKTPDPIGEAVKLDGKSFVVVGVLARAEANIKTPGLEEEDTAFIPLTTGVRVFGFRDLDFLFFQPDGTEHRDLLRQRIQQLLLLRKGPRSSYQIDSLDERMAQIENLIWVVVVVFGSIAAVSLLVAGIGIMNIMLLSVMERTREIGIRKSVGARRRQILEQFFAEAVMLSATGGLIGVAIGAAGVAGVSVLAGGSIALSIKGIGVAVGFALLTGVVFGLYPAVRAARLDPITALAREAA